MGGPQGPEHVPAEFWTRSDVREALPRRDIGTLFLLLGRYTGASQTWIGNRTGIPQNKVSGIVAGTRRVAAIDVLERIADGLHMPDDARHRLGLASQQRRQVGDAAQEDTTKRRDLLALGATVMAAPTTVLGLLGDYAAEALDFTRASLMSAVGAGTLSHLSAAIATLDRAWETPAAPAAETFAVVRDYRRRVAEFIAGRHTLAEGRELYVHAGWLSEYLAWTALQLGQPRAAEAYAIDSYLHATEVGHPALAAWACQALSCTQLYSGQHDKAIEAARRGIAAAPAGHPLAAQLNAHAARLHAVRGDRDSSLALLGTAQRLGEGITGQTSRPSGVSGQDLNWLNMSRYVTTAYVWLGDPRKARWHAETTLALHQSGPVQTVNEQITRIDLALAMVGLGEPERAAAYGTEALTASRSAHPVVSRAGDLNSALMTSYPQHPDTRAFGELFTDTRRRVAEVA